MLTRSPRSVLAAAATAAAAAALVCDLILQCPPCFIPSLRLSYLSIDRSVLQQAGGGHAEVYSAQNDEGKGEKASGVCAGIDFTKQGK